MGICRRKSLKMHAGLVAVLGCLVALMGATSASATTVTPYHYSGQFFDGTGSSNGEFSSEIGQLAIDPNAGAIYVLESFEYTTGSVRKFTLSGAASPFSDPSLGGGNAIAITEGSQLNNLAVDRSGGPSTGRIIVSNGASAYFPSGAALTGAGFPISQFGFKCDVAVDPQGDIWIGDSMEQYNAVSEFSPNGVPTGASFFSPRPCRLAIDSVGNFYVGERTVTNSLGQVRKYDLSGNFQYVLDPGPSWGIAIDPSNDDVFVNSQAEVFHYDSEGHPLASFGTADAAHFSYLGLEEARGIAVDPATHKVYVANRRDYGGKRRVEIFEPGEAKTIPTLRVLDPDLTSTRATLRGTINADDGGATTECTILWGTSADYDQPPETCSPVGPFEGSDTHPVSAEVDGLTNGTLYHYRLIAKNANGIQARSADLVFRAQGSPAVSAQAASEVRTDSARFSAQVDPNGGETSYRIEYGTAPCSANPCDTVEEGQLSNFLGTQTVSAPLSDLIPGENYYVRVLATNLADTDAGPDYTFKTFVPPPGGVDPCPNALVRKQTLASQLLDCRAYELVSARNAGGYDVASDLTPGQAPLPAYPRASDRLLYTLHHGVIPGIEGFPTNLGSDPYLAERGSDGWETSYVGIPATGTPSTNAFGSPLLSADQGLSAFVFGGESLCSPCFSDGETGIPLRTPDGDLVQGMAGSLSPTGFKPDGYVAKPLSADGSTLIFGSTSQFEPDGNSNGDVSIYKRDLKAGTTAVISKTPGGANLPCLGGAGTCQAPGDPHGIASLDLSSDGSRAVVAQRVSTDSAGNHYFHPYMHVEGSASTIDLAPGTTTGVLYAGMSSDGSEVYFTSKDQLLGADTDSSADLYRADVGSTSATLELITTFNSDACDPVAALGRENWNEIGATSTETCSVAAIAGGGGVASNGGAIYFLSPEQLDGAEGSLNAPNLYRAGSSIEFVATLEAGNPLVTHAVTDALERDTADLQVTPDGSFAVFASTLSLTGFPNQGHAQIYRYGALADSLDCVSCPPSGAAASAAATLSSYGLNLADDGRVFFTSKDALVLKDTNELKDAYEWSDGDIGLISTGVGLQHSGLLSVSSDGKDAFFFTHETLVAKDANGSATKIYTAREGGGFLHNPPAPPCQASDECHGPGTAVARPPEIGTFQGSGGQHTTATTPGQKPKCRKGQVRRRGKCVKPRQRSNRNRKAARRGR
jgi:hypothetical protein